MASLPNTVCPPPLYYHRPGEASPSVPQDGEEQLKLYRHCSPSVYDASATSLHWNAIVGRPPSVTVASPPSEDERAFHDGSQRSASGSNGRHRRLPVLLALAKEILSLQEEESESSAFEEKCVVVPNSKSNEVVSSQTSEYDQRGVFVRDCCAGVKGSSRKRVTNKTCNIITDPSGGRQQKAAPGSCRIQPQERESNVVNRHSTLPSNKASHHHHPLHPCNKIRSSRSDKASSHHHHPLHPCDKVRSSRSRSSSNSNDPRPFKSRPCNNRTKSNSSNSSSNSNITQHHSKSSIVVHMPKTTPSRGGERGGMASDDTLILQSGSRERANAVKTLLNELDDEIDEEEDAATSLIPSAVSLAGPSGSGVTLGPSGSGATESTRLLSLHGADVQMTGVGLGVGGGGASSLSFPLDNFASNSVERSDIDDHQSTSHVDVDGVSGVSSVQGESGGADTSSSEDDGEVAGSTGDSGESGRSDTDEEIAESLESGCDDYSEDFTSESSSS